MTEQQMKSISVDDLFSSGKISRKTYNILVRARMRNVFDLKRYESGLSRLFRAGTGGMKEIEVLLRELSDADSVPEMSSMLFALSESEPSKGEQLLSSLSDEDLTLLDIVYKKQIDNLLHSHERTAKKVANALSLVPVRHFIRDFLLENDERTLMLNLVETSLPQVASVKQTLMKEVELIRKEEVPVPFRILSMQADGLLDDDGFVLSSFIEHQHLPMLYVMQKALLNNRDEQVILAFLQRYDVFGGQVEIDDAKIDKSAFTITNYSNVVFDALFTPGANAGVLGHFVEELVANDVNVAYLAEKVKGKLITEDSEIIAEIIEEEHLLLQPLCVVAMLGKLLAFSQTGFGGYPRSFGMSLDERWKHVYVIDKDLADAFNFRRELWRFRDNVVRQSTESHVADFEAYVTQVLEEEYPTALERQEDVTAVMKAMALGELDLKVDDEERVIIPRKRDKPLADRLYAILDKNKQPMMLDDLTEQINSGEGRRYVRASVSLALNKDERFQGSGKKGCYALSVWQLPYFGSNADIVYRVLDEANRPMRSEEIVNILSAYSYNSQFSKNDLSSVISLGKNLFRKFGLGYYGLVGRDYPSEDIQPSKRVFEAEAEAMEAFIDKHRRVPSAKGDEVETRLRTWFSRKRKEWESDNNWSENKRRIFALLVAKYDAVVAGSQPVPMRPLQNSADNIESPNNPESPESPAFLETLKTPVSLESPETPEKQSSPDEWDVMAAEVRCFVEKNAREPLAMFTAEVMLADWLAEQKKRMRERRLSEEQTAVLLGIRDMIW